MNLWGFKESILNTLETEFESFLKENINEPKKEFFIPMVVDTLINRDNVKFRVLETNEKWYGITYKEDLPLIKDAIKKYTDAGLYK